MGGRSRAALGRSGADDVWATYEDRVFRGAGPLNETNAPGITIDAIWVGGPNEAYVGGVTGLARWNGTEWIRSKGIGAQIRDVAGDGGQVWAVGDHGAILRRAR